MGLPEKVEGHDPIAFVEHWLQEIFGKESFTPVCSIAGTPYTAPAPPAWYPTQLHASQALELKDRKIILHLDQETSMIQYNKTKVSFFPTSPQRSNARDQSPLM